MEMKMVNFHPNLKPCIPSLLTNPQHIRSSSPLFKTRTLIPLKLSTSSSLSENNPTEQSSSAGNIRRFALSQEARTKLDAYPDREFYEYPRFVTHVDDGFLSALTNLYRERLRPDSEILDLMSSWVSHLPKDVKYKKVVGHGLNAAELAKNPQLDYFFVKDLNQDQKLEMESSSFDAVLCAVSVQYLQQPEKVKNDYQIMAMLFQQFMVFML